jgi:hypothetical protein
MKAFVCACIAISLTMQVPPAFAQSTGAEPNHNPERRGIRLLHDDDIRSLSTRRTHGKAVPIDERKSIFVTDVEILKLFTFEELMDRLVEDSGSHTLTRDTLFQQWWDTANPKATFSLPSVDPIAIQVCSTPFPTPAPGMRGNRSPKTRCNWQIPRPDLTARDIKSPMP